MELPRTLHSLRTSDTKEWVTLNGNDAYMSIIPQLHGNYEPTIRLMELQRAEHFSNHPCEWVKVCVVEHKPLPEDMATLNPSFGKNGKVDPTWLSGFNAAMSYFGIHK